MKKFIVVAFVFGWASVAVAAPPKPDKAQFVDFGPQVVNGAIRAPGIEAYSGRKRPEFKRLLRLKKSLLPRIYKTAKEPVFK